MEFSADQQKAIIKAEVFHLGFSLFGVTTPDAPQHLLIFNDWLDHGFHAGMKYLEKEESYRKRSNPGSLLPGCKSVIMLGVIYPSSTKTPVADDNYRIASYASVEDYHEWIPEILRKISALISEFSPKGSKCLVCTDSAPVLERDLAWRAGLGWIGKNGCLISPECGSSFLIAEIFTELELSPDEPFQKDLCGKCTRCLDACPTGCILPNRTLDARKCIAYLTIENKGEIPTDLRPGIGNHIFGCDICQDVCPWNQKQTSIYLFPPLAKYIKKPLNLKDILTLEILQFQEMFNHTSIIRANRVGFLRNAAVVMGNQSLSENLSFLESRIAIESDELVRSHLVWAASKSGGKETY